MLKVVTRKFGGVAILGLQGRVVNGGTDELSEAIRSQSNANVLILDLAQVELIDAKGLGVLLELREFAQSRGIEFRLMNVNRLVQQVLELTRLDSVFETVDEEEIRAAARGQPGRALASSLREADEPANAGRS